MGARRSGRATALAVLALVFAAGLAGCDGTADSIGYDQKSGGHLAPLTKPASYPNLFKELGHSDVEIANKIAAWFAQLFHGDAGSQSIYFTVGTDQANIQDILHNKEIRTEGMGLGMMVAVQLDKREEFDRLWTYAATVLERKNGAGRGYFQSHCDTPTMTTEPCDDPYGEQQMLTALIFAHDRWGSTTTIDYETEALELLNVLRHKEDENGGVVDGVTNTFDVSSGLPWDVPTDVAASQSFGRPSIVMPAYYDLWAQATGDAFWTRAAAAARDYWRRAAHPMTGLMPVKATFTGEAVPNYDNFLAESYRAQINMALDQIWTTAVPDDWEVTEADRLLSFFSDEGIDTYGATFTVDGTTIDPSHDWALVACNGVTAMIARMSLDRAKYVSNVWAVPPPVGTGRYYTGILGLTSLLMLSGQYMIW